MNWGKVLIGGIVAGVAMNIVDFVLHGMVMRKTYMGLPDVFDQEPANPLFFVLVAICISIAAALLFAKSRECWGAGAKGGATFGAFLGLFAFFPSFYQPLVIADFPYYLAWCHGGIAFIATVVAGTVLGLIIKRA